MHAKYNCAHLVSHKSILATMADQPGTNTQC